MFDNRDNIDFGKEDIPRLFGQMLVPTLLGMVFNIAFTLTDGIFVGHRVGPMGLACVNLVAPIMMMETALAMMFGIGCSVVAAIHLAKGNTKAARINVTQAFLVSGLVAILLGVLFYCFPHRVLTLLGVSATLMEMAREYYLWFIPTAVFLIFQIVGEFVIRLDGSPRYAMYANIIPALVNIMLDYLFIYPCGMGVRGAALATDIGTGVGALMALGYMVWNPKTLAFYRLKCSWTGVRLMLRNACYMAKMGLAAFVSDISVAVMMMAGNWAFAYYMGDDGVAAYSVICYLFPVVFMIYNAVAQASQPIISFNHGAGEWQRVRRAFRRSLATNTLFGAVMTVLFVSLAPTLISIFLNPATAAYPLAVRGLPLVAAGFVCVAFNISAIGYYQSVERALLATLLTALRGILLLVPAFILLPLWLGDAGLWLSVPCAELLTLVTIVIIARIKK